MVGVEDFRGNQAEGGAEERAVPHSLSKADLKTKLQIPFAKSTAQA